MFNQKNTDSVLVKTYDSIISEYRSRRGEIFKVVLSPWKDKGYKIKEIPDEEMEINLFSFLDREHLTYDNAIRDKLISKGYCIEQWEEGEMLTESMWKQDKLTAYKNMQGSPLRKELMRKELVEEGKLKE